MPSTPAVISVNVGPAREVPWRGRTVRTGIFKEPVEGPVRVAGHQATGDEQADLSVHGGPDKALYLYPSEHYGGWRGELPPAQASVLDRWGAFGENLTTRGLMETDVAVGDRLRVGSALLRVTGPRVPCHKLGLRFDDPQMVKRFHAAGRNGFYLAIEEPGEIGAGDEVHVVERQADRITPHDLVELHTRRARDPDLVARALAHAALPEAWRSGLHDMYRSGG